MSKESSIHVLDQDTINKIAAGEVVERPASVVKELVDNAIDAGAKNIRVELKDSGKTLISVRDDGKGMSREDVILSPTKHATSKLSTITDLESISTMGFRGEALAAISSVSKFEIITKRKEDSTGTRLYLEDGKQEITDVGAPDGTTVSVHTLFYNTPARLKYMKSDATELSHIAGMVSDLILANPAISFTLTNNGKTILSGASSNLFNSIVDILGHEAARVMMEIPSDHMESQFGENKKEAIDQIKSLTDYADIEISGYISKPTFSKTTTDNLYFIVNNRPVTSKELIKAIRLGYYTKLPKDRYPAAVIHLKINPTEVDVNVHPRKVEVRFKDENRLVRIVSDVIETTLRLYELAPKVTAAEAKKVVEKSFSDFGAPQASQKSETKEEAKAETKLDSKTESKTDSKVDSKSESKSESNTGSQISKTIDPNVNVVKETPAVYSTKAASSIEKEQAAEEKTPKEPPFGDSSLSAVSEKYGTGYVAPAKDTDKRLKATERLLSETGKTNDKKTPSEISILDHIRIVGQISNLYILAEKDGGLLIIDQHAAHERIFYDIIKKRENVSVQELISPVVINLTPKEKVLMDEYIPYLEEVGFGISEFGDYAYAISFVPVVFGKMEEVSTVHDFIADLLSFGKVKDETGARDTVAKRTACRAAIKAGASCNQAQMEELIRQLKLTENPYSCPHGRPTILIFSQKEIEKLFERS
ncbi:DNA mismatch repair endonuclease MutL [Methanimicrococcus blatticola]|uniref:DNA mismatch repair protein MutL n=1 Tax=Methanimicrococcus blatticola TaxID=91560 RepID=A0A484F7P3_9EURY|nr:DNA mismatch repair endonuclease MutL [Methanimicrococcus blatticola]MBZ3936190.1 DNA mismatch repair endonuclease MutL [Methanimicrococcus blatticola]MCC2508433.1 DNA mismatch repair endonuclease MutL [Methanimicrococcus blatticola]TDQ70114.1 DNA mismatch repair protein MutL [Methanimicrococcus blatticola]